jgi:hypothetical protein
MRKVLMVMMLLLVFSAVASVRATPAAKIPFTAEASFVFGSIYPGEPITEDSILFVKRAISDGIVTVYGVSDTPIPCTLVMVHDLFINLNIGLGECHGKFVITIFGGGGAFEGSEHGTHEIAESYHGVTGNVVADGTGMFQGLKMMASYEGEMITDGVQQVVKVTMTGTLLSLGR